MSRDRSEEALVCALDAARERVRTLESELVERGMSRGSEPEDRYRVLVENSADAIFIMDGDTFVDCNQATVEMFGCDDKKQLLEMHPSEVSPPVQPDGTTSYDKANRMLRTALRHGSHRFEWDHARADGEVFPAEVLLTPISETGVGTFHAVVRDITQRKELESQLRQSQRMEAMGQLAGGIAHDFNNLLMIINGNVEKLIGALGDDEWADGVVRQIGWAGQRAAELTAQLLASSRKQVLQPAILDLNRVAGNARDFLRRLIGEDIELSTDLSPDRVHFKADPGLIDQVIINLATNARDAMPEGGKLTLDVSRREIRSPSSVNGLQLPAGSYAILTVADTGVGMDAEILESAFEPFFTTKPRGEGSGLGLSMVYGIVRQSGGHLEIRSEPARGTAVEIWFPAVDEEATIEPEHMGLPFGGDETILVVEDDETVANLLAEMLGEAGYTVLSSANGLEALELYGEQGSEIDLILSDVVMPQMGGPEMVRRLLAMGGVPPVIFASGYAEILLDPHDELEFDAGFLQKPFNRPTLLRSVRKALDRNSG